MPFPVGWAVPFFYASSEFWGARCTLQYSLRLVEPRTGCKRNQWVTGVIYAEDRSRQIWKKLRAADPGQQIPEAFQTFEPVSFIPDLNMVVQVFPYDRRIPALPFMMAASPHDLGSLFFTPSRPGEWHADVWNIEPIWYRAGARAVLLSLRPTQSWIPPGSWLTLLACRSDLTCLTTVAVRRPRAPSPRNTSFMSRGPSTAGCPSTTPAPS